MDFWKNWNNGTSKAKRIPTWGLGVAIGVCLLIVGAYHDQFADIYRKAVMICLECIGIG